MTRCSSVLLLGFMQAVLSWCVLFNDGMSNNKTCASRSTPSEDPFENMCYLAQRNGELFDIHLSQESGHRFSNHLTYHLVALYKLGANASRLGAAFAQQAPALGRALPSSGFIDNSNWREWIGAYQQGKVVNTSIHYSDYVEFFRGKIKVFGEQAIVDWALPDLIDGMSGSLFHAVIQLGYYYESQDPEILAEGLAWMATGFTSLSPQNPSAKHTDLHEAMAELQKDTRLPSRPSVTELASSYSRIMGDYDLVVPASYSHIISDYDLVVPDEPTPVQVEALSKQLSLTVLDLFASTGYSSFFILHIVTGTRAVQVILAALGNHPRAQARLLRRHWSAVLHHYVAQGRPEVYSPAVDEVLPSWSELSAATVELSDTHLAKLVYLSRENDRLWSAPLYRQVADRIVKLFQSGQGWSHLVAQPHFVAQPHLVAQPHFVAQPNTTWPHWCIALPIFVFVTLIAGVGRWTDARSKRIAIPNPLGTSLLAVAEDSPGA